MKKNEKDAPIAAVLAGENVSLVNVNSNDLNGLNASDFENTGATKIELEPEEGYVGIFDNYEMVDDDRNEKKFCVCHCTDFKSGVENFMTLNGIYERNLQQLRKGNIFVIACTGEGANENGKFKKYSISQKKVS